MQINKFGSRGGNIAYSRAGLRQAQVACNAASHYNEIQIQNTVQFVIDGTFGALAPADNQPFSSGHAVVTGCNECFFGIWVNNTNVIATTQGAIVNPANLGGVGGNAKQTLPFPDFVDNNVLIGLLKVKVGVGAVFTPGTTNLNVNNVTATFFDTATMPSKPHRT